EVVRDGHVLRAGLVGLRGADVEVAERVARVPVARLLLDHPGVLGDRKIELALPEQLFRFLECFFAFAGQGSFRSYQTVWAGGTIGGGPRNSRIARPRRGGRASRSPCGGRIRSGGPARAARAWRGRGSLSPRS